MKLYRVTKKEYATLDGFGGLLVNGRWHNLGKPVVYLSENRSLAILEALVHINNLGLLPSDMVLITVRVPEQFKKMNVELLPKKWASKILITRKIGDDFLRKDTELLLSVPSVIVPEEYNFILNPRHLLAGECEIEKKEPLEFDNRLFGASS